MPSRLVSGTFVAFVLTIAVVLFSASGVSAQTSGTVGSPQATGTLGSPDYRSISGPVPLDSVGCNSSV